MMSVGIQQTGGFSEEQMQAGVRFEETSPPGTGC